MGSAGMCILQGQISFIREGSRVLVMLSVKLLDKYYTTDGVKCHLEKRHGKPGKGNGYV